MAIIPLRAYNREIEGLIDNGQLDEAVAHCRHILATFPKYIATYRLLGKAHLEQQRISDTTDIFQRVLSAIPDDFIANVGMSIIREDENNLDASIWHMELAYEAQPSNVAIQDELRRLYGRRDGVQPPKVRLTRGALAKMYAKGGLFDQAIAELRAAIKEDPNRPDLQLLLAQMFFQISQRVEAVETCVAILKKLPFCLSANQILAVCLPEADTSEGSKNYRQVAVSMDPYFAFATLDSISSDQVPESSVNIEKLEWKPGFKLPDASSQPTWATSLGISLEQPTEEKLPEWLKETEVPSTIEPEGGTAGNVTPFIWDTQEVERIITEPSQTEGEIPDWMKDAGWNPASEEAIQNEKEAGSGLAAIEPDADLAKADIPDWLRGIAPAEIIDEKKPEPTSNEKDSSIPWLEKQEPGPTDTIIQWLDKKDSQQPTQEGENLEAPAETVDEDMPDWLKDLDVTHPSEAGEEPVAENEPPVVAVTPAFTDSAFLDELQGPQTESVSSMEESVDQPPMESVGEVEVGESLVAEELPAVTDDELPDWIKQLAGELPEEAKSTPQTDETDATQLAEEQLRTEFGDIEEDIIGDTPLPAEETEIPALIQELPGEEELKESDLPAFQAEEIAPLEWTMQESETGTEEITPLDEESDTGLAVRAEEIPDWIKGLGETPTETEPVETLEAASQEPEIPQAEELPPWLLELDQPEVEMEATSEGSEALEWKEEELPDWIKEITESAPPEAALDQVDSLADTQEIIVEAEPETTFEAATSPGEPSNVEEPSPLSEDAALPDWIRSEVETTALDDQAIPKPELEKLTWEAEPEVAEKAFIPPVAEITPLAEEIVEHPITEGSQESTPEQFAAPVEVPVEITDSNQTLERARNAIVEGDLRLAVDTYSGLIKQNQHVDAVIKDLQEALYRFPVEINLWLALGDAQFQSKDCQAALDTYNKAEDLVR